MAAAKPGAAKSAGSDKGVQEFDELMDGLSSIFAPRQLFHSVKFDGDLAEEMREHIGLATSELRYPTLAMDQPIRDGRVEQRELDMLWMTGFVDHDAEGGNNATNNAADAKRPRESRYLSGAEIARIREIEKQQAAEKIGAGGDGPRDMRSRLADSEYLKENDRIRRALVARRKGQKTSLGLSRSSKLDVKPAAVLRSSAMDRLILLERMEMEAAAAIQRRWRKHQRIMYWKRWLLEKRCQEIIARVWRAYAARMRARIWRALFFRRVVLFQAQCRGWHARQRYKEERLFLSDAATDIERIVLGWLVRRRLLRVKLNNAATRIAAFWRGCVGRGKADRMFLDRTVTLVQRNVRRYLVQRAYRRRSSRETTAATRIQQMYRKWKAVAVRDVRLWDRETQARREWMEALSAERTHVENRIEEVSHVSADVGPRNALPTL